MCYKQEHMHVFTLQFESFSENNYVVLNFEAFSAKLVFKTNLT